MKERNSIKSILLTSIITAVVIFSSCQMTYSLDLISENTFSTDEITKFDIDLSADELEIVTGNDSDIKVEILSSRDDRIPVVKKNGSTLDISYTNYNYFFYRRCLVRVTVPASYYVESVIIDKSSGSAKVSNLSCNNFYLESSSGSNEVKNISCIDNFYCKSSSGSLNVQDISCANFTVESSSGNSNSEGIIADEIKIESSSGSIDASKLCTDKATVEISSGSMRCEFENLPSLGVEFKASSGSSTIYFPENDGFYVSADTSSGTYYNQFTETKQNHCSPSMHDVYKTGNVKMSVASSSGSVRILRK